MTTYYSIQSKAAYNQLENEKILTGKESFIIEDFLPAYKWLVNQMKRKLTLPRELTSFNYPVWLWTQKPDLNTECLLPSGQEGVCLTLEIEDSLVLLSDFDAWHCVLNNWFCSLTSEEDDNFNNNTSKISIEESWHRIFDLKTLIESELWESEVQTIQATTPAIYYSQILLAEPFIAN